jgi:protein-tyrosine phosphatase
MFNKIIVICTGNICRSPMGEALLRERLKGEGRSVISAGIGALSGYPADPLACEIMQEKGIDISTHRAQQATLPLLSAADLLLVMDSTHMDWLAGKHPQLRGRIHKMLKWQKNADVADPYRLPRSAFEKAYADIEQGVEDWLKRL